jgi:hypothetical protein
LDEGTSALPAGPDSIILQQLQQMFKETANRSVEVIIMTLLPRNLSPQAHQLLLKPGKIRLKIVICCNDMAWNDAVL